MPKQQRIQKRQRRNVHIGKRNRNRSRRPSGSVQTTDVHRRLVLYPTSDKAEWLDKLAWFSSVALKLIALVTGISDDLTADTKSTSAGTVIILGPGDFAAFSPFAVPVTSTSTDKEVLALRSFPYERASLPRLSVKIVPSVDQGARGGMYAAVLIKIDPTDAGLILETAKLQKSLLAKYSYDYDTIIKNPKSVLAPVGRPITLSIGGAATPHNIRSNWSDGYGFVNQYPTYVLCVAYSDLACSDSEIVSQYTPSRSLFEVHLRGVLKLHEPGELVIHHDKTTASQSCYSSKLLTSTTKDINTVDVKFFEHTFPCKNGKLDLRTIDPDIARKMLVHFDRLDLIKSLEIPSLEHLEMDE